MKEEKALNIIAGLCSKKEYCTQDVLTKLQKWELTEEAIRKILDFLYRHQFIDVSRFAKAYAEDKFQFNHWGKQKIAMMLRQKNIPSDIVTAALESLNAQTYDETCLTLLKQKLATLPPEASYRQNAKLIRLGLGRGFDYDTLHRCIGQLLSEEENSGDI